MGQTGFLKAVHPGETCEGNWECEGPKNVRVRPEGSVPSKRSGSNNKEMLNWSREVSNSSNSNSNSKGSNVVKERRTGEDLRVRDATPEESGTALRGREWEGPPEEVSTPRVRAEEEECASDETLDQRPRKERLEARREARKALEEDLVGRREAREETPLEESSTPHAEGGGSSAGEGLEEEAEEEGRQAVGLTAPRTVTKEERDEHERTHIPFRCWCRACVKGRKRNMAHRQKSEEAKKEERTHGVPRISMDYHFMSRDDEEAKRNPIITMVNESTGDKYSRAVGGKGVGTEGRWIG